MQDSKALDGDGLVRCTFLRKPSAWAGGGSLSRLQFSMHMELGDGDGDERDSKYVMCRELWLVGAGC